MIKKIVTALFAITLLSGCCASAKKYNDGSKHIAEFEKVIGDRVYFAFNKSDLSTEAKSTLKHQADWLNNHTKYSVTVEGHCDERGTREYNIALGERRAESVKTMLVKSGLSAERIDTISYGKERPAVIGNDEKAYSLNRRAVTAIR
ncbi:MAG: peptidoglycan-associated lipoprotein Pal [Rickettsiaceae bacterium]